MKLLLFSVMIILVCVIGILLYCLVSLCCVCWVMGVLLVIKVNCMDGVVIGKVCWVYRRVVLFCDGVVLCKVLFNLLVFVWVGLVGVLLLKWLDNLCFVWGFLLVWCGCIWVWYCCVVVMFVLVSDWFDCCIVLVFVRLVCDVDGWVYLVVSCVFGCVSGFLLVVFWFGCVVILGWVFCLVCRIWWWFWWLVFCFVGLFLLCLVLYVVWIVVLVVLLVWWVGLGFFIFFGCIWSCFDWC